MMNLKLILAYTDKVFLSIWGVTIIDTFFLAGGLLTYIDDGVKTLMALAGLIYFIVTVPQKIKMQRLERKIKEQELKKLYKENYNSKDHE